MLRVRTILIALSSAVVLASCDVATFLQDGPLPDRREQSQTGPQLPTGFSGAVLARYTGGYGGFFNSNDLDALIAEAASHNPDYLILRGRADRELLRIADRRRSGGPSLSAALSDNERRGAVDTSTFNLSVDLNPGLDIWGKAATDIRAGVLGSQATLFDLVASERALQKTIVRAWSDLIAARLTLQSRHTRLDAYNRILESVRAEVMSGQRDPVDVQLSEIDVLSARNQLESQRQQVDVAETTLNRLLGRPVGQHVRLRQGVLPRFAGAAPVRLPSELLLRRPDIQAAWARLMAVDDSFRSARLAMLPRFNLTGSLGNTTSDFSSLLNPDLFIASLMASLTGTLLDNGASQRQVDIAMASVEIEVQSYASTVLDAMVQVHSVLSREQSLKRQIQIQKLSAALAEQAFEQEINAMRNDRASLQSVSTAALRLYNAEDEIISLRNRILQNRLDLYVALGDDYFDGESR